MTDGVIHRSELPGDPAGPAATPQYGFDYYDAYGRLGPSTYSRDNPHWLKFFGKVADSVIGQLNPQTALDVGCAKGFLVECLRDRAVEAYGFDVSEYAIGEVRDDIKPYCWVGSAGDSIRKTYDLITCIEVCEHIPESDAQEAIRQMASHTSAILFSSTPSNFEEPTHINVHPVIDWLRIFAQYSFAPDQTFNCSDIAPQAMLLRRVSERPTDQVLCHFANLKNQEIARAEIKSSPEYIALEKELSAMRNSKGWRLLNIVRSLRSSVKHPVSEGYRKIQSLIDPHLSYDHWIKHVEQRSYDPARIALAIAKFSYKPKISIVMPVYNTPIEILNLAIQSVLKQHYQNWELCICDDASSNTDVRQCLENWQKQDRRIKVSISAQNEGISAASNRALQLASGEFVGLLDHDDELSPDALYEVVKLLQMRPESDMIYSDEDRLDVEGRRIQPFFKPDWSPEYMLAYMYTCHFGVYRRQLLNDIGGFRAQFDGSQDYDLVLRLSEITKNIFHIPKILYHWRILKGSAADSAEAKPYAFTAARKALNEHLKRKGIDGQIVNGISPGWYKVQFDAPGSDRISIIVLCSRQAKALKNCIENVERKTLYANYDVLVTHDADIDGSLKEYLSSLAHKKVSVEGRSNSSQLMNAGAGRAGGHYLLFLSAETEIISPDWITCMLGFCRQDQIGVVGAKLLDRNGLIQHAGLVLGLKGVVGHPLRGFPRETRQAFGSAINARNYSAVGSACMMVRKSIFDEVQGFDDKLTGDYKDVDFCLRVQEAGYRIVWTPWAELYHDEVRTSVGRRDTGQIELLRKRWQKMLSNDPYYNPNLTLKHEDFGYRV